MIKIDMELELPSPVLILEDDIIMQRRSEGLLQKLGYKTGNLFFANTLKEAENIIQMYSIQFALIDLGLPDGSGVDIISKLMTQKGEIPILVVSTCNTLHTVLQAIEAGASGYFLKDRDDFEILLSIRSVIRGGAPIDPFLANQILKKCIKIKRKQFKQYSKYFTL